MQELESCIGCMQRTADCKLQKMCVDSNEDRVNRTLCQQCFCRPMWCTDCMARWFASRQKQSEPERWMAGKSPCPTCRSVFCVLDVAIID